MAELKLLWTMSNTSSVVLFDLNMVTIYCMFIRQLCAFMGGILIFYEHELNFFLQWTLFILERRKHILFESEQLL